MAPTLPRLLVTFADGKIGRRHDVRPLEVAESDPDAVATAIHRYARKYLMSQGVDVEFDLDPADGTGEGVVTVGMFRTVATFTIKPMGD